MMQQTGQAAAGHCHTPEVRATREFVFKTTRELSAKERDQFCTLFECVFQKDMSRQAFERKYTHTPLGHSHHGLMLVEGQIVGAYNLVPYQYQCFGSRQLFGLSVDAMIDKEHRNGPFNMVRMAKRACEGALQDGVVFAFGFPNDAAHAFTRKILKWTDLGDLEFYALPINIGVFRESLAWANPLSRLCAAGLAHMPRLSTGRLSTFPIEKICDGPFRRHRYDERHGIIHLRRGGECTYRVCEEDNGIRAFYIIDVTPLTAARFAEAVRRLHGIAATCADLMLYVGRLPFPPKGLLRVPPPKRPRRIRMCGTILDPQRVDQRILEIDNWNINISNFDVR